MKNFTSLFFLVFSVFSAFAQSVSLSPLAARAAREVNQLLPAHKTAVVDKTLDSMHLAYFQEGEWVPNRNEYYTYDSTGKRTQAIFKTPPFDSTSTEWLISSRERYEYTPFDSLSLTIIENYNSWDSTWLFSSQIRRAFSATHQLDSAVAEYQDWGGNMMPQWRTSNSYNGQDLLSESIHWEYLFDGQIWGGEKSVYTYNDSNWVDTLLVMSWDTAADTWVNESQTVYVYNASGVVSKLKLFDADSATHALILTGETVFTYDANGRVTIALTKEDMGGGVMMDVARQSYTYDNQGNLLLDKTQVPNFFGAGWLTMSEQAYTYDADGYNTQQIFRMMGMTFSLEDFQKNDYFWNAKTTATEAPASPISIYMANPARAGALVQVAEAPAAASLRVLDLTGRVLAEQPLLNGAANLPATLTTGLYLVQIQVNNAPIHTIKILVTE